MEAQVCKMCGKSADEPMAWKCDQCGAESAEHDANHGCGSDHCVVKCSECKKPETQCECK